MSGNVILRYKRRRSNNTETEIKTQMMLLLLQGVLFEGPNPTGSRRNCNRERWFVLDYSEATEKGGLNTQVRRKQKWLLPLKA